MPIKDPSKYPDDWKERRASVLKRAGYAVEVADNGIDAAYLGREEDFGAVILDLGLPGKPGLEVLREWRDEGMDAPVLILTARDAWQDKVAGLEAGADDYVTKPFHVEELMARINALMRRAGGHAKPKVELGPITIDLTGQRVFRDGEEIELTTYEYKVLNYLVMHPDEIVTKTDLSEHIYEEDSDRDSNVIEVFIGRLRRKIDPDGSLNPIETLRGRGYRLALTPSSGPGADPESGLAQDAG